MQFITFYNKLLRSRFLLRYAINNLKKNCFGHLRSVKSKKVGLDHFVYLPTCSSRRLYLLYELRTKGFSIKSAIEISQSSLP